jgi:gliding motility-associated-like protein
MMNIYIHKYKLAFFFACFLVSGLAYGQAPLIDSMIYDVHDNQYFFACRKATSIDLFKAANFYVSPENGYWGDAYGVPYNGKTGTINASIKERQYTNGNIFTPPASIADTGTYKFYFYFTSLKGYCGINKNTRFILNLYIGTYGCLEVVSEGELDNSHYFCFGSSVDMNPVIGKYPYTKPVTVADLLLTNSKDPTKWKKTTRDWVDMEIYADREHTIRLNDNNGNPATGNMVVDLEPSTGSYDTTYYMIIHVDSQEYSDSINITVYPKSELKIYYSPDIRNTTNTEYGMDDRITIRVDTSEYKFDYYTFLMNNNNLNKKYFGGDTTKNEITLSALAFSGVEDFIEIIAADRNNCIVRAEDNVVVRVPFPTVFTPDGDGMNDIFLGGEKFRNREFHLEIFNRWANRLYYGESGWDGTYRGNKVPPGTYLYTLELKLEDGSTKTVKGTVVLIRESR